LEAQIVEFRSIGASGFRSAGDCKIRPLLQQIHSEYTATSRLEQLNRDLAEETEADDGNYIAERNFGRANSVECDRPQRAKRRFLEGNVFGRNFRQQQARYAGELGMNRVPSSSTGDSIANRDVIDSVAYAKDCARTAIANGLGLVEAGAHSLHGREQAVTPHLC
jgi:hypothetical protein